jgi:cytochrome c peroxidase
MKGIKAYSIIALVFPVLTITAIILGIFEGIGISTSKKGSVTTTFGDVKNLQTSYDRWKAKVTQNGENRNLVLHLGYSKGLSAQFTNAHGRAMLNLVDASLFVEISGLSDQESFDVWVIDNRPGPGHSVKPEPGDVMVRIGSLKHKGNIATLHANLDHKALMGFKLNLVTVTPAGKTPETSGLLFGSLSLFQRLYYSEQCGKLRRIDDAAVQSNPNSEDQGLFSAPFRFLIPSPVYADVMGDMTAYLSSLVEDGEDLFFNETFDGNGRTCGTCHPADNNLTIDPAFIETLPDDDLLFVAEFNDALSENFENPELMRQFGLILENVDGFDDLENKFVMRGVPHTLALSTSLTRDTGLTGAPAEMTGWSGDGSPGGTLRDFATGAVTQHFTKTLNRTAGVDFRLPTDEELDAMEAFQLSLGRQEDLVLPLALTDSTASTGQDIFMDGTGDPNAGGKCSACHFNAGANNAAGLNRNFNTRVEELDHPARLLVNFPHDGGFGTAASILAINGEDFDVFGNGTFNMPPLVEAADTGPFFHNNIKETIEDAVDFYNSDEFNNPRQASARINHDDTQVTAVAAFLRVINAIENIRSTNQKLENAEEASGLNQAQKHLDLAIAEITDAIEVLSGGDLHPDAVKDLEKARKDVVDAKKIKNNLARNMLINKARTRVENAHDDMVD